MDTSQHAYQLVVRGLIEHDDRLLLVKHETTHDHWVLPGGRVNPGEKIEDALKRELIEELAVEPKIGNLLFIYQLRRRDAERIEFLLHIENGSDYKSTEIGQGTHSRQELADLAFSHPSKVKLLPLFIADDYSRLIRNGFNVKPRFMSGS